MHSTWGRISWLLFRKIGEPVLKRKLFLICTIVLLLVFISSLVGIGVVLYRYHQADVLYDDLQDRYVTYAPRPSRKPTQAESAESSGQSVDSSDDSSIDVVPGPIVLEYAPIGVNFDLLLAENSDVAGWLYCEDTPINYPVVRSLDNEDYLHRDLNGKYLYSGSLFTDYRCSGVGADGNLIIYGHNMKNDTMFGTLDEYKKQAYFDEHPVLYYLTPECDYKVELFAGLVTKSNSEVYNVYAPNTEAFEAFLQYLQENSIVRSDVEVTREDHIVTLSTCSYEFNNARYTIFGKLTPLARD